MEPVRLFTIGDDGYFLGVVALVNSLRVSGNHQPITVLDLGFTPEQRRLLAPACDLADAPRDRHPHLTKMYAPLRSDARVVVLIDSDAIVTGSLDSLVADANAGAIAAAQDPEGQRFFPEWAEVFDLRAPLARAPYVNSGVLAFSRSSFPDLLDRWSELCERLTDRRVLADADADAVSDPVWLADQDALNALLMSEVAPDSVRMRPDIAIGHDAMRETRIDRWNPLSCTRRGSPVRVLHSVGSPKPWQSRARWEYRSNAYIVCLRRLLTGPGLVVTVPLATVPAWLRPGVQGGGLRCALRAYDVPARWSRPLRRRLRVSPWRRRDGYIPGRE